jgi:two-component system, cell cycle sensor histidine kinase and response regulator CckA
MPADRLLKERDGQFRLLFEANPQPMWVFDLHTRALLEVNRAAVLHFGYTPEEFRYMQVSDLILADERQRFLEAACNSAEPQKGVWRHRTKSGRILDVDVAAQKIQYDGTSAVLCVLVDVTDRRHLEEQFRQSQKMEAVGMLAGGVAHDFNNLLTIITGYSQLLLIGLPEDDDRRHSAEQIIKAGERAAALTRQLLAFSRRQVLQPRVLELNKLVGSLGQMLQRLIGEDVELRLNLNEDLGRVNADPGQLEQVIMNLVVNARDAMPKGGILTLETANVRLDTGYTGRHISVEPGIYVMLAVSDTGHGMDEATRKRLFEPFFTTKEQGKGTGLGLSTVFGIIKQSGGSLEVYSVPGQGTSVKVYLPRIDQAAVAEAGDTAPRSRRGSETILLVEDEEMVRTLVRETLQREGYRVLEASGPVEARSISDAYRGPIHLLITDVVMPKQSGREMAEVLYRQRPDMRILYMSGYTDNAIVNSGILEREAAFLQKPFSPQTLAHKVRDVIEHNGVRRAGE